MSLNIKDPETDALAREVAELAKESLTDAIKIALSERRDRLRQRRADETLVRDLLQIGRRFSALPVEDGRSIDDMLYDEDGLPK